MKGLLTPRQLKQIEREEYDLYEVLVAKHMWHKIARRMPAKYTGTDATEKRAWHFSFTVTVSCTKRDVVGRYGVWWLNNCLLCELYRGGVKSLYGGCADCPLGTCDAHQPCLYRDVLEGSASAAKEIEETIEADWQKRVSEMDARRKNETV